MITPASLGTISVSRSFSRLPLDVRQLAADPGGATGRHVHQEPARQADLGGQPGALVPHRVLRDLHEHAVAAGQRLLDARGPARQACGVPVDLACVEHGVAAAPDVDERGLHAGQHVLHAAEVDVADQRRGHRQLVTKCSTSTPSSSTPISERSPRWRTTMSARRPRDGPGTRPRSGSARGADQRPGRRGGAAAWPRAGWSHGRSARRCAVGVIDSARALARVADLDDRVRRVVCRSSQLRASSAPTRDDDAGADERREVPASSSAASSVVVGLFRAAASRFAGGLDRVVGSVSSGSSSSLAVSDVDVVALTAAPSAAAPTTRRRLRRAAPSPTRRRTVVGVVRRRPSGLGELVRRGVDAARRRSGLRSARGLGPATAAGAAGRLGLRTGSVRGAARRRQRAYGGSSGRQPRARRAVVRPAPQRRDGRRPPGARETGADARQRRRAATAG